MKTLCVLSCSLLLAACVSTAETITASPKPATLPQLTTWIDRSLSPNARELQHNILPSLLQHLRAEARTIDGIEAIDFGSSEANTLTQPSRLFTWGPASAATAFDPKNVKLPLECVIFSTARDKCMAKAKEEYDRRAAQEQTMYWSTVDAQLEKFATDLQHRPATPAACTRFDDLFVRMRDQRRPVNLVLSDSDFDCPDSITPDNGRIQGIVILLTLPRNGDNSAGSEHARLQKREQQFLRLFPTAVILRPYQLDQLGSVLRGEAPPDHELPHAAALPKTPAPVVRPQQKTLSPSTTATGPNVALLRDLQDRVRRLITGLQAANVRPSIGPYQNQCFTDQDLQDFIAANKAALIARNARSNDEFQNIASDLRRLTAADQSTLLASARQIRDKTWTETGSQGVGQTDAGARAHLLISAAITEALQEPVQQ